MLHSYILVQITVVTDTAQMHSFKQTSTKPMYYFQIRRKSLK